MEFLLEHMVWIWVAVTALAAFLEASTPVLVSVWFGVGALVAMFSAWAGASLTVQVLLFVFVSLAALLVARPLAKRFLDPHIIPTNADRLLGTEGRVLQEINNDRAEGAVYADGKEWTARSADGETIPAGTLVEIASLEGVKLIVRPRAEVPAGK